MKLSSVDIHIVIVASSSSQKSGIATFINCVLPTMSKKNLCTSFSTFLKRTLTSIPEHFPSNFTPHLHSSPSPPSASLDRLCHNPTFYYSLRPLRFCGSKAAEKLQTTCWNCHAVPQYAPFLFCDSCRCIQPVDDSIDYFEIFGS